ncbi:MAG: ParB/RepB/Spo0J family partition protein [Candidatus Nanopelagicales bacterium]
MTNRTNSRRGRGIAALIPSGPPDLDDRPRVERSSTKATTKTTSPAPKAKRSSRAKSTNDVVDLRPLVGTANQDQLPNQVEGLQLITAQVSSIKPNPQQPRTEFDPDALDELAISLKEVGFLQPVVVRKVKSGYELVAGERRWRASQLAGFTEIPAIIRSTDDDVLLRDALLENLQRVQLNPIEEAAAYEQLLSDFGGTHEELAAKLGRSRPQVTNTLRLLKLSGSVQRRVAAGVLSAGHARALVAIEDPEAAEELATRVVAEGISVRGLEELVALGDGAKRKKRKTTSGTTDSLIEYQVVADRLSDRYDTRVKVTGSTKRGKIVIDFAGVEDLHRLVELLDSDTRA